MSRNLMRDIAQQINAMPKGMCLEVSNFTLGKIGSAQLVGFFGPTWKAEEWIMENVIGSSWNIEMTKNPMSGNVTFSRLEKESTTRLYTSPDRRNL